MKMVYDFVFVTHLPAFYKVNLYQQIAQHCRVFVIFIANHSTIRVGDFVKNEFAFDACIINQSEFEKRHQFFSVLRVLNQLRKLSFRKLVVGGWDLKEFWWLIYLTPKVKNCLALESSFYESAIKGVKAFAKRLFLRRIHHAFVSGEPHATLLSELGFKGKRSKTLGVGIFNYQSIARHKKPFSGKFLYVGRLAPEKNLLLLFEAFAQLPQFSLTVIGQGPLWDLLQKQAPKNVQMLGYVPNESLSEHYLAHDVFVLPSLREPWGLVVEEALYHGLPVILSERVGCANDLILDTQRGLLFDPQDRASLIAAILTMAQCYALFAAALEKIDFKTRDAYQVQQYLEALG